MKRKTFSILAAILSLTFVLTIFQSKGQALDPTSATGIQLNSVPGDGPTFINDYLFAFSNDGIVNSVILNGIEIAVLNQGWFSAVGSHNFTNENYICGYYDNNIYRNFNAIDLSDLSSHGITPPITSASLKVKQYESEPTTGFKTWYLSAVTTNYSAINVSYAIGDPNGIAIFEDLGDGTSYGSYDVDRSQPFTNYFTVTLNSAALAAMNNSIGSVFVIGGKVDSIVTADVVPLSNWALGIGIVLILTVAIIRMRRFF